jgi:hypothetical protein
VRGAFINGRVTSIGYLGQLRIHPAFCRRRDLMNAGFDFCRRLDESADRAALHVASVVSDNVSARRLLARRSPGWPSFEPVDTLVSLAIPVNHRRARSVPDIGVRAGSPELLPEILSCLHRYGSRFQFFPRWTASDFASARTRGLVLEDFVVASRGGRIVGCAACWDQRAFKQVVVRGYSRALRRWRPVINAIAPITGTPRLPAAGTQLPFVYASHLAVEDDRASGGASDAELTIALLDAVCRRARAKGAEYVVVGLPASSAEVHAVKRAFRHRAYESVLYVAHWPDGAAIASSLDGRPSNPELAIL